MERENEEMPTLSHTHLHPGIPALSTISCRTLYDLFSTKILRVEYFIEGVSRYKLRPLQKMKIMDNFVG